MKRIYWLAIVLGLVLFFVLAEVGAASAKWKKVKSPVDVTLRAVYFGDSKTVFAVGDSGTIIMSKDEGKTWKKLKSGSTAKLRGVHFTGKKNGWVCGDGDPNAPSARGHVVSGRPMNCGTCLITSNGGKSWECVWVHTNFDLRSIWMASGKVGQICNHGGSSHADGDKVLTSDGGRNWSQKRIYRGLNDCCWVNEKVAWAVGSRVSVGFRPTPTSPLYTNNTVRIIHTSDGGQSWAPQDCTDHGRGKELRSVWFVSSKSGCAVGDAGAIFITTNSGKKWQQVKSGTEKALYAVCFTDKKNGWAVGEAGTILATTDGGKKWKKVKSPVKETLFGLHFNKKGKAGIAVGTDGKIIRLTQ